MCNQSFENKRIEFSKQIEISPHISIKTHDSISVDQLFDHYYSVGFIYPEKKERIDPFIKLIKSNWKAAWQMGKDIAWTLVFEDKNTGRTGTVTLWRTTNNSWFAQHLTSSGCPVGVCSVLLESQAQAILGNYKSGQNWYCPLNSYAKKIYGSIVSSIGDNYSSCDLFHYLDMDFFTRIPHTNNVEIVRVRNDNHYNIFEFAQKNRGRIYAEAEELNDSDIELITLDNLYKQVGLRRKRYIWMAFLKGSDKPKGAIIVYRGPLGMNFSWLENRCDLIIDKSLDEDNLETITYALVKQAIEAYKNETLNIKYPLTYFTIVADESSARFLKFIGARQTREYHQSIWLDEGFKAWSRHIKKIYARVIEKYSKEKTHNKKSTKKRQ